MQNISNIFRFCYYLVLWRNLIMNKLLVFLIMLIVIIISSAFSQEDERGFLVKIGQKAPDFSTKLIDGNDFKLSDNLGKVIILQFTASWCSVCIKEMPHLEKEIWQPLKNRDFLLIGVDRDEPIETVQKFAKFTKVTYPLALDIGANIFGLYANKNAGVTRNIVIDKSGNIVFMTRLFDKIEFEKMKKLVFELTDTKID